MSELLKLLGPGDSFVLAESAGVSLGSGIEDFERFTGLRFPDDVRELYLAVSKLELDGRKFSEDGKYLHATYPSWGDGGLVFHRDVMLSASLGVEPDQPDEVQNWFKNLVPLIVVGDDTSLCLDCGFDPVDPPVVWVLEGSCWNGSFAQYVASDFASFLRLPSSENPSVGVPSAEEPTERYLAWEARRAAAAKLVQM